MRKLGLNMRIMGS